MNERLKNYCMEYPKFIRVWIKTFFNSIVGIWKVFKLKAPRVTFFGGARLTKEDPYYNMAFELAYRLAEENISIITGGGPGIMEAANCGAAESAKKKGEIRSLAIGIKDLRDEKGINLCAQESIMLESFFARKWLMSNYSTAFLVFPGGYGTLDELGEVLNLMETYKLPLAPIILYGKDYWQPFMEWVIKSPLKRKLISKKEESLFTITDDIDEVICILLKHCKKNI